MYRVTVPVRFSDLDAFGHVNHARYLGYCEDHRSSMFRGLAEAGGRDLLDLRFVIAEARCRYLRPIRFDRAEVEVRCSVRRIGRSSLDLDYEVVASHTAARVEETVVFVDESGSRPLQPGEIAWLQQWSAEGLLER